MLLFGGMALAAPQITGSVSHHGTGDIMGRDGVHYAADSKPTINEAGSHTNNFSHGSGFVVQNNKDNVTATQNTQTVQVVPNKL